MTRRWKLGDEILGDTDGTDPADVFPQGLEIRSPEGSYWHFEGQTWTALTGPSPHLTSVSTTRICAEGPAVVVYVPPVPPPHTKPGHYVCAGECAYRFHLRPDGLWEGPWTSDGRYLSKGQPLMYWHDVEDSYGDCARSLLGPIPAAVLKGV